MLVPKVSLSEATITRISHGETVIIRVGELVEIEVTRKATPRASEIPPNPKTGKALIDSIFGAKSGGFNDLFNGIFRKKTSK
jgi:hypothetical protein